MAIFMSYCPQFRTSRAIYMFERYEQKHFVFASYGCFHVLLPTVLGFQDDLHVWEWWPKTHLFCALCPFSWAIANSFRGSRVIYMFERYEQKLVFFAFYGHFHELLPIILGVPGWFTCLRGMSKNSSFFAFYGRFHELFPRFGVSGRFKCFRGMSKNSFCSMLYGRFHELLPTVLGF